MSKSGSKILLATVFGLAVGAGIGLLFAPAKGSKTRKRMKKMFMKAADIMQDEFQDKISTLESVFSQEEEEKPVDKSPENK
jgi:gas vesicle protein